MSQKPSDEIIGENLQCAETIMWKNIILPSTLITILERQRRCILHGSQRRKVKSDKLRKKDF